jgi:hypothetical protein
MRLEGKRFRSPLDCDGIALGTYATPEYAYAVFLTQDADNPRVEFGHSESDYEAIARIRREGGVWTVRYPDEKGELVVINIAKEWRS